MPSVLSAKHYHDEDAAFAYVERHVWPNGPTCPHCGGVERISKMQGGATRKGLYKCYQCRRQFTVRMGTIFEASHVPLHIWLQAIFFVAGSKKGISSNQLHRTLGVTLKTAWFMSHRIREAMRDGTLAPMGGAGAKVEVDETFIGQRAGAVKARGSTTRSPFCRSLTVQPARPVRWSLTALAPPRSFRSSKPISTMKPMS
jgi:transposase-like protein